MVSVTGRASFKRGEIAMSTHVFIDDSGDPGFKIEKGSSSHFVIAMVIFDDELEIERTAVAIKELRRQLRFLDTAEFKFFKASKITRIKFLETVKPFEFKIRYLVVDKAKIYSDELKTNRNSFYSYFIKEALKHNGGSIVDAKIRVDGHGDRVFRRSFLSYLRRELNGADRRIVDSCKLVDSKTNVMIQMADMIAGSIGRFYRSDKTDHGEYKAIIQKHIENEWKFM